MGLGRAIFGPVSAAVRGSPALRRWALRALPDVRWRVDVREIGPLEVRLRRHRSFWLRDPLTHEGFTLDALRSLVKPGDVVWDVGANIGLYSRFVTQRFGASRVLAFEPMDDNRVTLERNLALGGVADRVTVLPFALSDRAGEAELQVDDVMSATAALDEVTGGAPSEGRALLGLPPRTQTVPLRTVDGLIDEGQPAPAVMKIDIEGAELLALRGATRTLAQHRPKLMIELHGPQVARDVTRLLLDAGYTLRGALSERLDPERTGAVTPAMLDDLRDRYDLSHVVAG